MFVDGRDSLPVNERFRIEFYPDNEIPGHVSADLGADFGYDATLACRKQASDQVSGRSPWNPPLAASPVRIGVRKPGFFPQLFYRFLSNTQEDNYTRNWSLGERFMLSATATHKAGFGGVELHVGHGYMCLSKFSGDAEKRRAPDLLNRLISEKV